MSLSCKKKSSYKEKDILTHLYSISNGDHNKFMKKILLIRNDAVTTDDEILNYVAKTDNISALNRWISLLEDHYEIEYESEYDIFSTELSEILHLMYDDFLEYKPRLMDAVKDIYDINSKINVKLLNIIGWSNYIPVIGLINYPKYDITDNNYDNIYTVVSLYLLAISSVITGMKYLDELKIDSIKDTPASILISYTGKFNHIDYLNERVRITNEDIH